MGRKPVLVVEIKINIFNHSLTKAFFMKRFVALLITLAFAVNSFSAINVEVPPKKATEILIPLGNTGKQISLMDLAVMNVKEYQQLIGHNLKFPEKVAFKLSQRELKKLINPDGTINAKKFEKIQKKMPATGDNRRNLRLALIFLGVGIVFSILSTVTGFFWILASLAYLGFAIFFILWLINMAGVSL